MVDSRGQKIRFANFQSVKNAFSEFLNFHPRLSQLNVENQPIPCDSIAKPVRNSKDTDLDHELIIYGVRSTQTASGMVTFWERSHKTNDQSAFDEVWNHKNYLKEGLKLIYCYHTDVMSMNLQALLQALLSHTTRFFGLQVNLN